MKESWRDVVGFKDYYQVSNLGNVWSVRNGRLLRPFQNNSYGHLSVGLCVGGVKTTRLVHRVVLEAWVGKCPEGFETCHGDGNPRNNKLSNLRWDSRSSNQRDRHKHGNSTVGKRVRRSDGVEFKSMHLAADMTGCGFQNIWKVCNEKRKTAGGFGWEYV